MAMALETTPAARHGVSIGLLACGAWLVFSALSITQNILHPAGFFLSTDDAMRLAQLRDLMGGQSWFDTNQIRMNTPYGLAMHWPHYVDAALICLIFLLRPFAGAQAEMAAIWLWPLLIALPAFLAIVRIGKRLAGREGAIISLVLTITCVSALGVFQPGRIDHHNVQLALCLWMAAWLLDADRPRHFAYAAIAGAFSLAVGLETMPYVLVAALFATGLCVVDAQRYDAAARAFGFAFAAAAAIFFVLAPTADRIAGNCDAWSLFYAPAAAIGGLGLAALTYLPQIRMLRLGGIAALAIAIIAVSVRINPECLSGPYAQVNPLLDRIWLSRIEEAQPAWNFMRLEPGYFIAGYIYALACFLATCAFCALTDGTRRVAVTMALLTGAALAIATFEVRGMNFAMLFGLPGLAALIVLLVRRIEAAPAPGLLRAGVAMALLFAASDVAFDQAGGLVNRLVAPHAVERKADAQGCAQRAGLATLDALPAGRIAAFVDEGPAILAYTHHAAMAGPYHRGAGAILDTNAIFAGSPARAAHILATRKIDYVMTCPASPDDAFYRAENRSGFLAQLDRGIFPAWLAPIAPPSRALRLYRVSLSGMER